MRTRIKRSNTEINFKRIGRRIVYALGILAGAFIIFLLSIAIYYAFDRFATLEKKVAVLEEINNQDLYAVCDVKDAMRNVRKSVVRIVDGEAEGSGFFVDNNGLILTNFHVIEYGETPRVVLPDGTHQTAQIVMADKNTDLAFIRINSTIPALKFGDSDVLEQTDELFSLGFPFGSEVQGELSIKKGILSGKRFHKDTDTLYLQTDSTLNPGISGGPMTNKCGEVVGINTLGASGAGFAISSSSIQQKWQELQLSTEDPLKDIIVLDIKPNESALHAVQAFYDYIRLRRLDKAWELLGEYKKNFKYENWKKGYEPNLDTSVLEIEVDEKDENKINVYLGTKDLVDGDIVIKYYEGYWIVKKVDGKFLLWDPEIKEIKME